MSAIEADPATVRATIAAVAATGPFFRLAVLDESGPTQWRQPGGDLSEIAAATAVQLGTREPRVAASILHLGLAARLWSPVLGCGLLRGVVPDLSGLLVTAGPPVRLGVPGPAGWIAPTPADLAELSVAAVTTQLARIAAALPARLPAGLHRGNSASAMAGALGELVRAQPRLGGPARRLAALLLSSRELRGSGELTDGALSSLPSSRELRGSGELTDGALSFRRNSCCLYYRVPGGGLCGDCCLARAPG